MPTIYKLAIRPANLVVPMATLSVGTADTSDGGSQGISVNIGGGFTNPPTVTFVQIPSTTQIIINGSVYGGPGTHTGSDWEVTTAADTTFASPVLSSYDDASNLLSITFDSTSLTTDADYLSRTRQTDSGIGDSDWSPGFPFTNSVFTANEPAGMTSITDRHFLAKTELGWGQTNVYEDWDIITNDTTAPSGDDSVGRMNFSTGYPAGDAPANTWYNFPASYTKVYVSFYLKVSSNWQGAANGKNKIGFLLDSSFGGGGDPLVFMLNGAGADGLTFYIGLQGPTTGAFITQNYHSNLASVSATRDVWHHVEFIAEMNSGASNADGLLDMWVNGTKTHDYNAVCFSAGDRTWTSTNYQPGWGQVPETVDSTMYMYMDRIYLSGS